MLAYLVAYLHPESIQNQSLTVARTFPAASDSHAEFSELTSGMGVTVGWLFAKETGNY